jgi:hypothetical protein
VLLRPESRGSVKLASSNPQSPVRIFQNFLATEDDWATLLAWMAAGACPPRRSSAASRPLPKAFSMISRR